MLKEELLNMQKFKKLIQRSNHRWVAGLSVAAMIVGASAAPNPAKTKKSPIAAPLKASSAAKLKLALLDMPLSFELNRGQADAKVQYLTRAQNFTVFLTPGETVMRGRNADVLRMKLQGANQTPKMLGEDRQLKVTNYYIGSDRSKWLEHVPNYGQVRYRDVYSGIDMIYHSDQRQLEYDFVVRPGADPNQIGVVFEGATKISITKQGELELKSAAGDSVNHKPVIYQTIDGRRKLVEGEFALASNNVVGFKLGEYDKTQPLVIDPSLQVLSFFGGTLNDEASGIATSAVQASLSMAGIVFVGRSESPSLPGPASKPSNNINWDAFATGLNAGVPGVPDSGGTTVLWTTYFGGSNDDASRGVAMDNQGNVYVSGYTNSTNFPAGVAIQYDAFVVKLAAGGGGLAGSALYGGPGVDQASSIALDYSTFSNLANAASITNPATDPRVVPNVVIGGLTTGGIGFAGGNTPVTPDGNQKTFNNCTAGSAGCGTNDGFVAIFSSGLALLHATYIGGGGNDQVNGVAVDIWGNIYATGFATPAVAPNFPVTRGLAQTTLRANWDSAQGPLNSAVAFVAKWTCTTGNPAIGVPSPPFGFVTGTPPVFSNTGVNSQFPICGGGNNLNTLGNSALFGGTASGGTFINPQQTILGQNGVTEAGLAIAVDQNGWGQTGVAGVAPTGFINAAGFPDIVPNSESTGACNLAAAGNNGLPAPRCAVSASNSATTGGFEPGVSGPHVYVVGTTASRDFANSLVTRVSCTTPPFVSSTPVPALCPVPNVFGSAVNATGILPGRAFCDTLGGLGVCPTGPAILLTDLRVKAVANGTNSGQTQGWLASFQFPAITQVIVQPPLTTSASTVTTLNPPTIPNYVILQPATCPTSGSGAAACVTGGGSVNTAVFAAATPPAANFGCTNGGGGVTCPAAFIGSWNAVAVDTDQQVYVLGQIGMTGAPAALAASPVFGTGAPNRLSLELQRISPYVNTPGGTGFLQPNFCPGITNAPCAFPLEQFPTSGFLGTDFIVDSGTAPAGILNSSYGQILPGAPPFPNPNQPGGLGNGIAVSPTREAFFVGTTTVTSPAAATNSNTSFRFTPITIFTGTAPVQATATANITAGVVNVALAAPNNGGAGYNPGAILAVTVAGFSNCTTTPGPWTATVDGAGVVGPITPAASGAGCVGAALTVTIPPPPVGGGGSGFPPAFQGNLGGAGGANAGSAAGSGPEDVIYGAIQFFDAIATPTVVNFTAIVNNFNSITGPNGQTGLNAKAFINYSNWQGQVLNIPPGCVVTPVVPNGPGGVPSFIVQQVNNTSQFQVSVNSTAAALGVVSIPGVVTSLVSFTKNGPCVGVGQPSIDSWDPLTLTLTVSAPLNLSPESTFQISSKLATGIVDQYFASGQQLVPNQLVTTAIDVTTASSNGPINFTAQIVPGQNWAGAVTGAVIVPTPTDIIYTAVGPNLGAPTMVPVRVNTLVLAGLPQGVYTAYIVFAASPETPALPSAGSANCGIAATVPVGSGTTSPACIPIVITIGDNVVANIPAAIVFRATQTPQQTSVQISNPTTTPYNFVAGYQATPVFGTALPAANVFFVGTGTTLIPASVGPPVSGTVPPGGIFALPIQINPVGLPTGVYSGQILLSNNGQASGATPQTTVPIIVYVGPKAGENTPSGNGLGLMLPTNVPPIGTGGSQGAAPGTPGSYPLTLSVPSGIGPSGANQIPNPTLIQITGLNNTSTTSFSVNAPTAGGGLVGVSFTNVGQAFGGTLGGCNPTFASLASLPGSPLGPPCVWSLWVDATTLNGTNTTRMAACGADPSNPALNNFGEAGTISFSAAGGSFPFSTLVVPLTICVTDFPSLIVGMPNTFPNPTFGPTTGTGFGGCNSGGVGCLLAQPSNLVPGFPLSITDMVLAASTGGSIGSTAAPINLLAQAGNSSFVCKVLDIRTNGGVVNNVTIAPIGVQWVTLQQAPAVFLGPTIGAPDSLPANSGAAATIFGLPLVGGNPSFSAGPFQANPNMQTFNLCVNTDPVGNAVGTFSTTVTINGGGVGPITLPINMIISNGTGNVPPPVNGPAFSQLGVFRPPAPVGGALGFFTVDSNGTNAFEVTDKTRQFGLAGDIPVAGDWTGTGAIRMGVVRCPAPGAGLCGWYLDGNNNGQWDGTFGGDIFFQFGLPGDIPVVGDWTGTGITKAGVMRCPAIGQPGVCTWYLDAANTRLPSDPSNLILQYGLAGDLPVVGNWAGIVVGNAPVDQIGVFRCPAAGVCQWIVDSNGNGSWQPTDNVFAFGVAGDTPVVGNWNGNGQRRIGVFRNGQWITDTNGNGSFDAADQVFNFGLPGDKPVVGFWTVL